MRLLILRRVLLAAAAAPLAAPPVGASAQAVRAAAQPGLKNRIPIKLDPDDAKNPVFVVSANPNALPFNPIAAEPDKLAAFHIPPRPPEDSVARERWEEAMRGVRGHMPGVDVTDWDDAAESCPRPAVPLAEGPGVDTPSTPSGNWAGAYVRNLADRRLSFVHGAWDHPDIEAANAHRKPIRISTWIGLDGLDPASRSMPQIGTASGWTAEDGRFDRVWWQWWVRGARVDDRRELPRIHHFDVAPGDRVVAIIHVQRDDAAGDSALFFFRNMEPDRAKAIAFKVSVEYPAGARRIAVDGRSAEWILERPMRPMRCYEDTGRYFRFPRSFDPTTFRGCITAAEAGTFWETDLERARVLRLTDWGGAASPGAVLARAAITSPSRVKIQRET